MAKPKKMTPQEELADIRKRIENLEFFMNNGGSDFRSPEDAPKLAEYVKRKEELEKTIEAELRNPPKEHWLRRVFRR